MPLLTKSKYMNGLQCPRLMWFADRKMLPEITISDEHKFKQGHDFEKYVKQLYPKHVDLSELDFTANIEKTKEMIDDKETIFEAGIKVEDYFIRADILKPNGKSWDLYEIKSTTQVKPQHIPDLAFQKFVCEKAGLKINKCFVVFLNNEYVKKGEINAEEMILQEEVTGKVEEIHDIERNAIEFLKILSQEEPPNICISMDCNKPYSCALKNDCWSTLPENNVLHLTNWRVYWDLLAKGIKDIKDIPEGTQLNAKDIILIKAVEKESPVVLKKELREFLDSLNYPLCHFDFETFDTAVPIFDNSSPYQKIPFQYSLHIQRENGEVEHKEFLSEGGDPRKKLLEQMKKDLKGKGDIIVFNKAFEISVMKKLAENFPEHADWLEQAINRIVDLADPFRKFYYYNKSQKGSYSIKKVLPAITGKSYSELEINNGGEASMLYFYSHIEPKLENKEEIRKNLLKYCELDTIGMVWIIEKLNEKCKL